MTDDEIIRLLKSKHLCADGIRRSAPKHCRLAAARIAEMSSEMAEQCRIIGAGGERELALMTELSETKRHLKTVLEREAETHMRHDSKLDELESIIRALNGQVYLDVIQRSKRNATSSK